MSLEAGGACMKYGKKTGRNSGDTKLKLGSLLQQCRTEPSWWASHARTIRHRNKASLPSMLAKAPSAGVFLPPHLDHLTLLSILKSSPARTLFMQASLASRYRYCVSPMGNS